jgi:hypothetical protein
MLPLAPGFEPPGGGPPRTGDARPAQVLKPLDEACRVARQDVVVAIAIPIDPHWRGQGSALERVGFLLEIHRRAEHGGAVARDPSGVLDERDTTILVAHDEVNVPVAVPVERHRHDHLQFHRQRPAVFSAELDTGLIFRSGAGADVSKIGETIEERPAEQVEVAITVEILDIG